MGNSIWDWSVTSNDNGAADSGINYQENQLPSTLNNSSRTVMARVKELMLDLVPTRTSGGTTTAYTVTSSAGHGAAPRSGQVITFFAHATNGANPTLNIDGTGAKAWRDRYATTGGIDAGRIVLGIPYRAVYNTTLDAWITDFGGPATSFITSSVTKTIGSGQDFATLADAIAWFNGLLFGLNGYVTLQFAAGATAAITSPIVVTSPWCDRLTIKGATMTGAYPTRTDIAALVTGVAQSADRTALAALHRARYATEVVFSGANGWLGFTGPLPTVQDLLFTADRTALSGVAGLIVFNNGGQVSGCSVHGSGASGFVVRDGLMQFLQTTSATGCVSSAIAAAEGASMLMRADLSLASCDVAGVSLSGSFFRRSSGYLGIFGCASGILATNAAGGSFHGPQTEIGHSTVGIDVQDAHVSLGTGGCSLHHANYGVYNRRGRINAPSTVFGTIATLKGYAEDGGHNTLTSSSGGTGTYSPAANSVGNSNAYNHV